jgi:hypothetical protein
MTAVASDASLYDYQESIVSNAKALVAKTETKGGASQNYGQGKMSVLYSEIASITGGGAGDTIDFMKLPPGTLIVGGDLYTEDGLQADNSTADLGVIYEDGDGTDDGDALCDGIDTNDGADSGTTDALPAGSYHMVGQDVAKFPYLVTGGWGTVRLLANTSAFVTAKDIKLVLFVVLPA